MIIPKVVVFDLGKVLLDFDYSIAARKIAARANLRAEEIKHFIDHSPLLFRYETGLMTKEQFYEEICGATGFSGTFDEFVECFSGIFTPIEPMVQLQIAIRQRGIPTYIFSNTNELAIGYIRRTFAFFANFDGYIFSYEQGAMKPDAKIYEVVERQAGHRQADILYLDDRPENVAAGADRGWQVILQESPEKTRRMVESLGLLNNKIIKTLLLFCLLTTSFAATAAGREWFVRQTDPNASDTADGSAGRPLRTINAAAQLAQPGDTITVGAGIYHEWVSPARGGSATAPILYRSVPEHAAIIRGTDVLDAQWQPVRGAPGVFAAPLPQPAFIFGNPFAGPKESKRNALVFLKDQPLAQVTTREQLTQTPGSWLAGEDSQQVLIHLRDNTAPASGAIEVTTRDRIFAPHRRGLGYIQVEGFVFERCATPPDWPQLGALSTRSGEYWLIRSNIVRDTTGKGIDCGSETWSPESLRATEPQDQRVLIGGHHLVQGNLVTNNAQCGIAAWNTDDLRIIGNIVCNNGASASAVNLSLTDFEAAGIKVHAFHHGLIEGNLVADNSSFGIWLDDGWENARVTRNVTMGNRGAGIFVELGFGPVLVDHNLSAANRSLGSPYFGDGIYTHDASGITITHNTFLDNAHYGVEQLIVSERVSWPKRLAEASNETISGNLFHGNRDGAISLPLGSPRSHDNQSDHNAIEPAENFVINSNNGRIPMDAILKACRERLQAADVPENQRPAMSDPKRVPSLSLPAWRAVMQMDRNSTPLPAKLRIHLDPRQNLLQLEVPTPDAIPPTPPGPADDFDLLGQPSNGGDARAGAIQHLRTGTQTLRFWPLPEETLVEKASAKQGL